MRYIYLLTILLLFSCNNERTLLLPEIENATVTEVLDVSPAYIFYDETEPDSTLLNRKNLISTTNWLVNVDKRLTLKQAIPKIIMMQEKKRNAKMHKNEDAKNYFTCNDTSIQNLGFLEFTDVYYSIVNKGKIDFTVTETIDNFNQKKRDSLQNDNFRQGPDISQEVEIKFDTDEEIYFGHSKIKRKALLSYINFLSDNNEWTDFFHLKLYFNKNLNFQNYIKIKSELSKIKSSKIRIDTNEFIY